MRSSSHKPTATTNRNTTQRAGKPITVRMDLNPSTALLIRQFASRAGLSVNDVVNEALASSYRDTIGHAAGK